jgi:glycosyltransferase involved in cell wall biosynthesis
LLTVHDADLDWPVAYLAMLPGEETLAERTLEQMLARAVGDLKTVAVQVVDVSRDARGPLYQALTAALTGSDRDLLLVRPGCELPDGWDARLRLAARSGANVGTASPLSLERLGIRAIDLPPDFDALAADRRVYAWSGCRAMETDAPEPLCFYLRRLALAAVAPELSAFAGQPEEFFDYFAQRIRAHGYCHVLADHVFVGGRQPAASPTLRVDVGVSGPSRPHYLAPLARTLGEALRSVEPGAPIPGLRPAPVQLHLVNSWGGGLCHFVRDYARAQPERVNLVLRPVGNPARFGEAMALYRHIDDAEPIRRWTLDPPIDFTTIAHLQYRAILEEVIDAYGVSGVLVSSLVGHSLDALCLDVPTAIVCHDYYPYCPALNIHFQGVCKECDATRLARCLAENRYTDLVRRADPAHWVDLRERFVERVVGRRIPVVAPSPSVARGLRALEPRLDAARFCDQPHGIDAHAFRRVPAPPSVGRPKLHAVVLGRMTAEKGADLLWDSLAELAPLCEITLVGCGNQGARFDGKPGVRLVPRYDSSELPALLEQLAPDFGLLLSTVPETFSYTLSELTCAGIPPVVTNLGSFADRVEPGTTGFLFEPSKADLVRTVALLHGDRSRLDAVRRNLSLVPHVSLAEMLAGYDRLLPAPAFCARQYVRSRTAPAVAPTAAPPAPRETFHGLLDRVLAEETFEGLLDRVYEVFCRKLGHTPRLKDWQRPLIQAVVGGGYRVLKLGQRVARYRRRPERNRV